MLNQITYPPSVGMPSPGVGSGGPQTTFPPAQPAAPLVDPATLKKAVDAVFAELEILTAARPILSIAVAALHQFVDTALLARAASRLAASPK